MGPRDQQAYQMSDASGTGFIRTHSQERLGTRRRARRLSLSVVIPTLNAAESLSRTLSGLALAERRGIDLEIIIVDGGSTDTTLEIAQHCGAHVIETEPGRGHQLNTGAKIARGDWFLFLHADTLLERGWDATAMVFAAEERNRDRAAVFTFALDDPSPAARRLERLVRWRNNWLGLPYGDQGLLINRRFYSRVGGFKNLVLMEDVEVVCRIGMSRIVLFDIRAITSAKRYRQSGYVARVGRNVICLALYFLHVPPRWIAKIYG